MLWHLSAFEFLANWAAQSAAVLAVAAIAVLCVRQPVKRLRLIEWTFAACLLLPGLALVEAPIHWSWPSRPADPPAHLPVARPARPTAPREAAPDEPVAKAVADWAPAATLPRPVSAPARDPHRHGSDPRFLCVIGYLAGAGAMAAWWLAGLAGLAGVVRSSRPADERCCEILRSVAAGKAARVRLLVSPRAGQPFMFVWGRPTIVLPESLATGELAPLRWSLAHEWSHAARGDFWRWSLACAARLALFYQPLVWWLRGQMRLAQDYLADADAAGYAPAAEDYAQFLASWAGSPSPAGLAILHRKSHLYRRVAMLVENQKPLDRRCSFRWTLATAFLGAAAVIGAATYSGTAEPQKGKVHIVFEKRKVAARKTNDVAEPNNAPAAAEAPSLDKSDLRYAGRTFQDWRKQLLNDLDPSTRAMAVKPIGAFGRKGYAEEAIAALTSSLHDGNDAVTGGAAIALAEIGPAAVPALIGGMADKNPTVRRNSVSALAKLAADAKPAKEALEKAISDADDGVRHAAIRALVVVAGDDEALRPTFERIADSGDSHDRHSLVDGFVENMPRGDWALRLLLRLADDEDNGVRWQVGNALARHGPPEQEVIDALKQLVVDGDENVRGFTIQGLTMAGADSKTSAIVLADSLLSPDAYPILDQQGRVSQAIEWLAHAREQSAIAVPVFIAIIEKKIPSLHLPGYSQAVDALGALGPAAKAAIPALDRWATGEVQMNLGNGDTMQKHARRALRKIRGAESAAPREGK